MSSRSKMELCMYYCLDIGPKIEFLNFPSFPSRVFMEGGVVVTMEKLVDFGKDRLCSYVVGS